MAPTKVDRIMLRFRPIAPKPAAGGSVSGLTQDNPGSAASSRTSGTPSRATRRRCRTSGGTSATVSRKRRALQEEKSKPDVAEVVTLSLLPDAPVSSPSSGSGSGSGSETSPSPSQQSVLPLRRPSPIFLGSEPAPVLAPQPVRPVGSWLSVECMTGTWVEGENRFASGEEAVSSIVNDETCPCFISDGWNRVTWTNEAYRKMVGGGEGEEMVVGLAMKEKIPETQRAFSCRVRVQYTCRNSLMVPCDVWRMINGGGFAWRLDIKAALSLGR